jgi:hypothetical protein
MTANTARLDHGVSLAHQSRSSLIKYEARGGFSAFSRYTGRDERDWNKTQQKGGYCHSRSLNETDERDSVLSKCGRPQAGSFLLIWGLSLAPHPVKARPGRGAAMAGAAPRLSRQLRFWKFPFIHTGQTRSNSGPSASRGAASRRHRGFFENSLLVARAVAFCVSLAFSAFKTAIEIPGLRPGADRILGGKRRLGASRGLVHVRLSRVGWTVTSAGRPAASQATPQGLSTPGFGGWPDRPRSWRCTTTAAALTGVAQS